MRPRDADDHVIELQGRDFRDTQPAAASQPHDYQITLRVCRSLGSWRQIGQDGGQFPAGQQTGRVEIPSRELRHGGLR
jgi:hypothetical protein